MASLDMSLDDMIKSRRTTDRGRGRGRARGGGGRGQGRSFGGGRPTGPPRKGPLAVNARPSAYTIAKSFRRPKISTWQQGLFEESLKAVGFDNGARLNVSNLDIGVTNEDIRELFSEIGELKRYAIHYDKNGRPSGSAEVLFARRSDAFQALKRYNNVQLDGKPMKIEIEGSNSEILPLSARVNVVGGRNGQRTVVMTSGIGRGRGNAAAAIIPNRSFGQRMRGGMVRNGRGGGGGVRGRGRGQSGGGRGRGRGRKPVVDKSADQLDKELENYHAMQT